jgi:hypothetical protein
MPQFKKPKPLAVCNLCGAITDQVTYVNSRCKKTVHGRRCSGIFRSGLGRVWDECLSCRAAGKVGTQACVECKGFGWTLSR